MTEHAIPPVPRSMEATSATSAARVAAQRVSQPSGWWGVVLFVASEATLFGCLFGTYFYLDFNNTSWPPPGAPLPSLLAPSLLTAGLILTSIPMQLGFRRARATRVPPAALLLALTLAVQVAYLALHLWFTEQDAAKYAGSRSSYGSIYYVLLDAHDAHLAVAILINAFLLLRIAVGGITNYRLTGLRVATFYTHFVNVLAVFVFLTQISPRL